MIICFHAKRCLRGFALAALLLAITFSITSVAVYSTQKIVENNQNIEASTNTKRSLPIYCVQTEEKKIAISFDCAWGVEHTDRLLQYMSESGVRCTFFAVQFWVEKYPEYVKKIIDAGHEMGTHSRTHSYMSKQTEGEIRDELFTSSAAIEKITGQKVQLFRPPYGDYDDLLIDTCNDMGLYPIQWDVDSLDWKNLSASEIALRVTNGAKNGSIILCHNNGSHTAEALPIIFSTLQKRGFQFVPISELIYTNNYIIAPNGQQKPLL